MSAAPHGRIWRHYHFAVNLTPMYVQAFRGLVVLVLGLHVFYMYCLARVMSAPDGLDLGAMFLAASFALAMLIPLVWAVTLPELPEIYATHWRARRRWKRAQCAECGYALRGIEPPSDTAERTPGDVQEAVAPAVIRACPECGRPLIPPAGYRITGRTLARYAIINGLAWIIGCAAGEAWLQRDERAFQRQVQARIEAGDHSQFARPRLWPNRGSILLYRASQPAGEKLPSSPK